MPYYHWFELTHAALSPYRAAADVARVYFKSPMNPLSSTPVGKTIAASCEMFERMTRRYGKPEWGLDTTMVDGEPVPVRIQSVWERPFCRLLHFEREFADVERRDPKVLLVAPMSGHYATLLRGTVETLLPNHDIYITDWEDARVVPLAAGTFDLDDYIDYVIEMLHALGGDTHVIAVCQPSVPAFAAVSRMEAANDPDVPLSMILMGGPIDTRSNPTAVNKLAHDKDIGWFKRNVITQVPFPHAGFMRQVYPGFLQVSGFMTMNLDRHVDAHRELYMHMVRGDGDSAAKHKEFYDEYMAVMDLTAEFYLQTVETVFIKHALPLGTMTHRGIPVDPSKIRNVALMTVEGEKDDITGGGQTEAAHRLASELAADKRQHYVQPGVGHYGVFNGSRFRKEIAPRIAAFMRANERRDEAAATKSAASKSVEGKSVESKSAAIKSPSQQLIETFGTKGIDIRPGAEPEGSAAEGGAAEAGAARRAFLSAPQGTPDDLTRISGVGPRLSQLLNEAGVWHFWQLAGFTDAELKELDARLPHYKGRAARDKWVAQASRLADKQTVPAAAG
ncbi:polyhydroxyalkanoate depolymerase [Blastochloris sulfoviridis]|uniref:Polyhydroxyalkanoate depolymerase n=1 Tax=Blastochloris sulfoviridis TaxID=50712 RepID=A0A5M6HX29_9HYPH|nr:polyhydroxyalkanoate depolymerase [Blastochloris sulfoviridis]KAA5600470.1 polyhydroxyalkanoate depolymerase [Blastochloris sulfoviridis]